MPKTPRDTTRLRPHRTSARVRYLGGGLCILASFLLLTAGCLDESSAPTDHESRQGAAARSPTYQARPQQETEAEDEDTPDESQETPADSVELTWFHGVAELPREHPCHDSTPVISVIEYLVSSNGEQMIRTKYERRTLGELRQNKGTDWVHFGPRTARGVRWKTGTEEFLVATCNMGGMGYAEIDQLRYLVEGDIDPAGAKFILGGYGEPPWLEWADLRWMRREAGGAWKTLHDKALWSSLDEGNNPEYVARARIISAQDADADQTPEVVAILVSNRFESSRNERQELCARLGHTDPYCRAFGVDVVVREGDQQLVERVRLALSGKQALTRDAEQPSSMDDATYALLSRRLEQTRDEALEKALAILREDEKLR